MTKPIGSYGRRPKLKLTEMAVRNVAPTFGKARYLSYSNKCEGTLVVESDGERLTSHMLTLDPRAKKFWTQPFTVDLIDKRILRTPVEVAEARKKHSKRIGPRFYTPDFGVEWIGLTRSAKEVKLEGFEGDDEYQTRLNLGASIIEDHGYRFSMVVFPRNPRHPFYSSLVLLKQAAGRPELWPDEQLAQRVSEVCSQQTVSLKDLCTRLNVSPNLVPAMLVSGCVSANLATQHLCGTMQLSAAYGDLSHLQLLDGLSV